MCRYFSNFLTLCILFTLIQTNSGTNLLGLSRCAGCYNHSASSTHWRGGGGDSSSSAEDSGSEGHCESDAESSSSSDASGHVAAAAREPDTEQVSGEAAGSRDGDARTGGLTGRAPLVKSLSLPLSQAPPPPPRPPRMVSTLQLQVLPEQQRLPARRHETTGRLQAAQWQQMGLPWQLGHQFQQQQVTHLFQHFPPCSARGPTIPPPLPVLQPPTLPQAQQPRPCVCCYQMHLLNTWGHYSSGELRW